MSASSGWIDRAREEMLGQTQPQGLKAKERLADLVAGQTVTVDWDKRDRNGRIPGKVTLIGLVAIFLLGQILGRRDDANDAVGPVG